MTVRRLPKIASPRGSVPSEQSCFASAFEQLAALTIPALFVPTEDSVTQFGKFWFAYKRCAHIHAPSCLPCSELLANMFMHGPTVNICWHGDRSGHRCIINECGDILVRPFPLEQRLFINLRGAACHPA